MYKQFYSKLLLLVAMIVAGAGSAWADTVTFTAGTDTSEETSITKDGITITFSEGVFNRTDNYRCYSGASMTISSTVGNMTQIDFTATSGNPMTKFSGNPDVGSWTDSSKTQWTGNASEINFGTTSGQARITKIVVTYTPTGSGSEVLCATPTFTPLAGTYYEAQNVTINCETQGATIYYTLDGTDPTDQSTEYTGAINVSETTTIKAIAYDATGASSSVASAEYTIVKSDELWKKADLSSLTQNDVFVIVGNNGDNYAMFNGNAASNAPTAVEVSIDGDILTTAVPDNLKWTISGNATDGYTFYPSGSTETWLYCTNSNNGVRVGINDNKTFEIKSGYLYNKGQSRYVGIYNSQEWRCYTSINSNIQGQTFAYYKKVTQEEAQEPSISAENVSIAYDATEGTISYTLNNPVDGGNLSAATIANWLTIGTVGDETISFTTTANDAANEREATVTLTYSYDNVAVTKDVTVLQAGNPNIVMTIAEVRAQATGDVVTKGVVTSCVGKTAYIQDETAAICVYGNSNLELNKGEEVKVSGSLSTYNGLLEITSPTCEVLSSDNNVTATVKTIEEINNDYAEGNTLQGLLVKIENATVTVINGQNTTIAQGDNAIVVRGISSDVEYAVDDVLTLTGNIGCFNDAQIANPTDVEVQEITEEKYYLVGSWGENNAGWDTKDPQVVMTNNNGVYSVTHTIAAGTQFKVIKKFEEELTWYGGESNPQEISDNSEIVLSSPGNNFIINTEGEYTFTVNTTGTAPTLTVTGWPAPKYFLAGNWDNGWNAEGMIEFDYKADADNYTAELTVGEAGVEFKVVDENNKWYRSEPALIASNCTVTLTESNDLTNMSIAVAGTYTLTLEKNNGLSLTIDGFGDPVVKYFLAGSFAGDDWNQGMKLFTEQEDGSFIYSMAFEANTEFKIVKDVNGAKTWFGGLPLEEGSEYYLVNKDWCTDIVLKNDTEVDGGYKNFKIEKAGDYTFKVTDEGKDGLFLDVAGWKVNYALVTDASQLEAGKDIILVGENNGTLYAMAAQKENNRAAEVVTKEKGIITVDHSGSIPFITLDCIEGEAGTLWGFDTDDGYLCSASSDKNYLRLLTSSLMSFTDHPNAQATIEIAEDGQATIVFQGEYSRNDLRFNYNKSGDPLFSCYVSTSDMPHAYIYMETELEEIPLEVTITEAEWATYVAEDDVTFPEGVTAYVPTTISTTSVGLTQVSQAMKGEAVIVNGAAGTYQLAYAEEAISEKNAGNQFEISDGTVSDGSQYVLSNKNQGIVGFYKVKAGVTIPTGKPYLVIENAAKEFVPFAGGEATGIETIDNGQRTIGDAYDLQGRKVQKLSKGIFIQNGRKVVVK